MPKDVCMLSTRHKNNTVKKKVDQFLDKSSNLDKEAFSLLSEDLSSDAEEKRRQTVLLQSEANEENYMSVYEVDDEDDDENDFCPCKECRQIALKDSAFTGKKK